MCDITEQVERKEQGTEQIRMKPVMTVVDD